MKMKIFAPVFAVEDVAPLAAAGAREFYCGIVPTEWRRRFGFAVCPNRRELARANLESYDDLAEIVAQSHARGISVHVAFNSRYYTANMLRLVRPMLFRLREVGVDALIVADVGLMLLLRELDLGLAVDVSSVAAAHSQPAVAFFRDLGARRILLPREMTVEEMAQVAKAFPDLEFESFMYAGGCFFSEACCTAIHGEGRDFFCRMLLEEGHCVPLDGRRRTGELAVDGNETLRYFSPKSFGGSPCAALEGIRPACGLCSVRRLYRAGVRSLKLVGRTHVVQYRADNIRLIRKAIRLAESDLDDEACSRETVRMRCKATSSRDPLSFEFQVQRCMLGNQCYYPDDPPLVSLRRRYWERSSGQNSSMRLLEEDRPESGQMRRGPDPGRRADQ